MHYNLLRGAGREFIIKDTHRGLYYEDGKHFGSSK